MAIVTEPAADAGLRGQGIRQGAREAVRITGIAAGGAGVGHLSDGRVVFVHRTAPGDLAEVAVTTAKSRWARARLLRVLEAGPGRRPAPCPHYDYCGGCTLEHLAYNAQLEAKARFVLDALQRIGHTSADAPYVVASPRELQYRNRVSFTLLRFGNGRVVAGFHELERPDRIADIDHRCLLPEPAVARAWRALRAGWGENASRLPSGEQLRLTLRASLTGEVSLLVEGGFGPGKPAELLERVPQLAAIWRRRSGEPPERLAGEESTIENWGGENLRLGGAMFLQVNRETASLLDAWVLERAGDVRGQRVIDAYSGIGLHGLRLARQGARVTCIEADPLAVEEGRRLAGETVEFVLGRAEEAIDARLPADLVVLNPPRTGLDAKVCAAIAASPPRRLLYVSCDPATLARDLGRLGAGFEIRSLRSFDMFPQTAHVETVAELACVTP
jgi:23S rRNA (uracil1939-C5)-methyltransferase